MQLPEGVVTIRHDHDAAYNFLLRRKDHEHQRHYRIVESGV
jgi:hypothetical protein